MPSKGQTAKPQPEAAVWRRFGLGRRLEIKWGKLETLAPLERKRQKEGERRKRKGEKWIKSLHKLWQTSQRSALIRKRQMANPAHWECSLPPPPPPSHTLHSPAPPPTPEKPSLGKLILPHGLHGPHSSPRQSRKI